MARGNNEVRFTANINDFSSKVQKMEGDVKRFASGSSGQINSFGAALGKVANLGGSGLGSLVGVLGKVVPALGAATAASAAFEQTINATQATQDAFGRMTSQMSAGLTLFFEKLATGDISSFISDLGMATSSARDLYNVLDNLGSLELRSNFAISMLESQRDIYELRTKDKALSDDERKSAQEMLDMYNKRISYLRGNLGDEQIGGATKILNTLIHNNVSTVGQYTSQQNMPAQYDPSLILKAMAKNIEVTEKDVLRYAESGQLDAERAREIISNYEREYMSAARNYQQTHDTRWLDAEKTLLDKFKNEFSKFPALLISLILDQVQDDDKSELKKAFDMMQAGAAARTATARDEYRQNRAGLTLKDGKTGTGTKLTAMEEIQMDLIGSTEKSWEQIMSMLDTLQTRLDENPLQLTAEAPQETEETDDGGLQQRMQARQRLYDMAKQKVAEYSRAVKLASSDDVQAIQQELAAWQKILDKFGDVSDKTADLSRSQMQVANSSLSVAGSLVGLGDTFMGLQDSIDRCKNGWELFSTVLHTTIGVIQTIAGISQALNAISQAGTASKTAETAATAASTTASTANAAAKQAEATAATTDANAQITDATAKTFSAHSWIPWVGVGIAAAMVASMFAVMMGIPKFETGGIVGGDSYTGDRILARLNSGEGVLTRKGMSNLESAFGDGNLRNPGGRVEFKIRDSELYGILNQYESKKARRV